jgi:polysaccharide biosynthesis transport protein
MEESNFIEKVKPATLEIPPAIPASSYPMEVMDGTAEGTTFLDYWRVIQKRRWTIASITMIIVVAVMISTLRQKPIYRSSTVLQIDRESPNILSFQGFVAEMNPYDNAYLETAYQVLQSRSLAYRVIQKLNLEDSPELSSNPQSSDSWLSVLWPSNQKKAAPPTPEEQMSPRHSGAIDAFVSHTRITPVRRSQLVEISYESTDPALSARVPNTIAANYIEMNLEAKWEATQKASEWLSQQLVGLKAKLEKSEEDLQRYAKDNSILFVDDKQNMNSQKLQQLQEEATKAQAELIQKESIYNQVRSGNIASAPGIFENKLYQDLTLKLSDLRQQYTELSATFAPEYPRLKRLKAQIDEVAATLDRERNAFSQRVTDEYRAAANRSRLLEQAVAQQTRDFNQVAEKSIQYNILKREADTNKQLYDGLLQRLKEASVSAGLRASNVRVVDQAEVPRSPSKPRKLVNLALSLIVGLTLGLGLAFVQEYFDNTLKSSEDVQRYLHLPTLGVIPANNPTTQKRLTYGGYGRVNKSLLTAAQDNGQASSVGLSGDLIKRGSNSPIAEAYRSLRTSVLLSSSGRPPRVILVTSGQPGEGKTTTAVNLAIALAQLGGPVLIIDSDMRRPRVGALLKLESSAAGLSTFLTGSYSLDQVTHPTSIVNLHAITSGPIPPNPAELLSSGMMQQLLAEAPTKFDYVVLDSPPVLHVSDSRILAAQVEATVLVAHGAVTPREAVKQAREQLLQVNGNIIGVLLNNVDLSAAGYSYYNKYYGHGYASDAAGDGDHARA